MNQHNVVCPKRLAAPTRLTIAMWFAIALAACNGTEAGQSGTEGDAAHCMELTGTQAVPADASTALGVPMLVASGLSRQREHEVRYRPNPDAAPTVTVLTVTTTADVASATLNQWVTRGNDRTICPDTLEMPVTVKLQTADSAFAEMFEGTVTVTASSKAFVGSIALKDLKGTYDASWFSGDRIDLVINFTDEGSTGTLSGSAANTGDTEVGTAEILSW